MPAWIVAVTKPGEEDRAAVNCRRQGFLPYLPHYYDRLAKRRRILFPRYLFVDLAGGYVPWSAIHNTRGIRQVMSNNGQLSFMRDYEIDHLRSMENENGVIELPDRPTFGELKKGKAPPTRIAPGEPVRIRGSGPFAGNIGVFQGQTVQQREKVLLAWLGAVLVPMGDLERVDPKEVDEAIIERGEALRRVAVG